ncbi:MAG: KTSC domain-containing protein [Rhizobiales bacterium]|nr:KTSC domain-containing protein [Hyphomicrobiales bacterium]
MPSTAIRDIDYDISSHRLTVTFVSGRRYIYDSVSQRVYNAFTQADSRGGFFNHDIRDHYPFHEIDNRK